jgi:hypothetical protein
MERRKKRQKRNAIAAAAMLVASLLCMALFAQDDSDDEFSGPVMLPKAIMMKAVSLCRNQAPPSVFSITTDPNPPIAGKSVIVKAGIAPSLDKAANAKVSGVKLTYSAASSIAWKTVPMVPSTEDSAIWEAMVKGGGAGSKVLLSVNARNSKGGTLATATCKASKWPPSGAEVKGDCGGKSGSQLESCMRSRTAVGCYFPAGPEAAPVDDSSEDMSEDLDILDFRFAYDSNYVYFILGTQKKPTPGQFSPMGLHMYSVMVLDPSKKNTLAEEGEMPFDAVLLRYVPQGEASPGFIKACAAVVSRAGKMSLDTKSADCRVSGTRVFFRMSKKLFAKNPTKLLTYSFTGVLREARLTEFTIGDITSLTLIRLGASPIQFMAAPPSPTGRVYY